MAEDEPMQNRWKLTPDESRMFREYVTAMMLNGQVTADAVGLHPVDLYVLNLLEIDGGSTPGHIAERTALTSGAVTKLLDRLSKAGFVQREVDPEDRRRVLVNIVDEQADYALGDSANMFEPLAKRMDDLIAAFPDDQRQVLIDYFALAKEQLEKATAELQDIGRARRTSARRAEGGGSGAETIS